MRTNMNKKIRTTMRMTMSIRMRMRTAMRWVGVHLSAACLE